MGDLRQRLKAAVEATPVPPGLQHRIHAHVQTAHVQTAHVEAAHVRARMKPRWQPLLLPAAAALAVCGLIFAVYVKGYLPVSYGPQASYIASVSANLPELMKVGLGDHIHCAVFRKYPKIAPTAAEFVETIGPKYADLVPIVQSRTPPGFRMLLAHQCHYLGRRFIHVTLGDGQHLLSLLITDRRDGETLNTNDFSSGAAARFRISAFQNSGYLVYLVSDLSAQSNAELLASMAPAVKAVLEKA